MTRLALLADLHFGSVPAGLAQRLRDDILAAAPDACLVAGDLTLYAKQHEFAAARTWLDELPFERLVVPGNHDVPRRNLLERFLQPQRRFEQNIPDADRDPLVLKSCIVAGLNTTAPWQPHLRWQEGRVRRRDAARLATELAAAPEGKTRIVLAHHPFAHVPSVARAQPVRHAPTTLGLFRNHGVDLVLSGHTHLSYVLPLIHDRGHMLAIGAPTALSNRTRGEANGYWLIDVTDDQVVLTLRLRDGSAFCACTRQVHAVERSRVRIQSV